MSKPRRARFVALADLLVSHHPTVDPSVIIEGRVIVDGRVISNPAARVRLDSSIRVSPVRRLRGDVKLSFALDALDIAVVGRVAIDVGASAGGFTIALLDRGARKVYAVDAGIGQLFGRLRTDERVVNLEGHNLADLDPSIVRDEVELVTIDLSYLSVAAAVPQLEHLVLAEQADLVALVKPTFELRRATLAASEDDVADALRNAENAIDHAGWTIIGTSPAPPTGRHGAREVFIHARRGV